MENSTLINQAKWKEKRGKSARAEKGGRENQTAVGEIQTEEKRKGRLLNLANKKSYYNIARRVTKGAGGSATLRARDSMKDKKFRQKRGLWGTEGGLQS